MTDLIAIQDGQLAESTVNLIASVESETARMIERRDALRTELLKAMEDHGVKRVETPELTVTYIEPTDREVFDKNSLRTDMPDIYEAYAEFKPVKSSIRVKLK